MPMSSSSPTDRAWEMIEQERGRDRLIKWISIAAWSVTFVIVGTLSTVGMFLRLRTTSLHEIQLRLAALEETLTTSAAERGPR